MYTWFRSIEYAYTLKTHPLNVQYKHVIRYMEVILLELFFLI